MLVIRLCARSKQTLDADWGKKKNRRNIFWTLPPTPPSIKTLLRRVFISMKCNFKTSFTSDYLILQEFLEIIIIVLKNLINENELGVHLIPKSLKEHWLVPYYVPGDKLRMQICSPCHRASHSPEGNTDINKAKRNYKEH